MRSPTYALIWEQWRQVRMLIALGVVLTFAASRYFYYFLMTSISPKYASAGLGTPDYVFKDWADGSAIIASIALVPLMAALLFSHSSARNMRMGVPQRMLLLPVTPVWLATTQIVFRFVTVALVALVIGLSLALIDNAFVRMIAPLVGTSLIAYSYASVLASTIGKRYPVVALVAIILTIAPVIVTISVIGNRVYPDLGYPVFYGFILTCAVISVASVTRLRKELPIQIMLLPRDGSTHLSSRATNEATRFSFEWRRTAWVFPSFTMGIAIAMALPMLDRKSVV